MSYVAIFALSEGQNGLHPPNEFITLSHSEGHRPGHLRRTRGAGTEGIDPPVHRDEEVLVRVHAAAWIGVFAYHDGLALHDPAGCSNSRAA